jgi:hypothetical protein
MNGGIVGIETTPQSKTGCKIAARRFQVKFL